MKKFFVLLCVPFVGIAHATTVNIDWLMDGSTYAQTTCETGGNFALPTPTPTKYGYHFVGWQQNIISGSWSQSGTPTPTNPIEPTFRQIGNTVLRAVGIGNNKIADTYDPSTGKITRRVGVVVLDGTENWRTVTSYMKSDAFAAYILVNDMIIANTTIVLSNALQYSTAPIWENVGYPNTVLGSQAASKGQVLVNVANDILGITDYTEETTSTATSKLKTWLADQHTNGTPVTVYYPLARPVEENYNAQ